MTMDEARAIAASPADYTAELLRVAKLKLFGRALRQIPSSPNQRATQELVCRIHARLQEIGQ